MNWRLIEMTNIMILKNMNFIELTKDELFLVDGGGKNSIDNAMDAFVGIVAAGGAFVAVASIPLTGPAGVYTAIGLAGTAIYNLSSALE
jgi:hypothetical protein